MNMTFLLKISLDFHLVIKMAVTDHQYLGYEDAREIFF